MTLSRRVFLSIGTVGLMAAGFGANAEPIGDSAAFQKVISDQIAAFGRDDGPGAFAFASPAIKEKFKTHENFMAMVRKGYSPVYRPKRFTFGAITREYLGRPTQRVVFVDADGRVWTALYAFEKQPDGRWLISGVAFTRTNEVVS